MAQAEIVSAIVCRSRTPPALLVGRWFQRDHLAQPQVGWTRRRPPVFVVVAFMAAQ
jgi:hypothetical protein